MEFIQLKPALPAQMPRANKHDDKRLKENENCEMNIQMGPCARPLRVV